MLTSTRMPSDDGDGRAHRLVSLGLFVGSLLLYARTVFFGFVKFDDEHLIIQQPQLFGRGLAGISAILVDGFPREEPLMVRDLSWLLDVLVFGFGSPIGHHLGNVLLNGACVVLGFWLLTRVLRSRKLAAVAAAFYAVLPVRVEPVAAIMGRKDLLSTFLMLLVLWTWDRSLDETQRPGRRWTLYAASVVLIPLACLSKLSAVVFFVVLALWTLCRPSFGGAQARPGRRELMQLRWLLPHAALSVVVFLWYHGQVSAWGLLERGPSWPEYAPVWIQNAPVAFAEFLRIFLAPFDHRVVYEFPSVGAPIATSTMALSWALLIGFLGLIFITARRRPRVSMCLAVYFVLMLPYANIQYIGIWVASRYLCFSSLWLIAALAVGAELLIDRVPAAARVTALVAGLWGLVALAGTVAYQGAWRSAFSLYSHEVDLPEPPINGFRQLANLIISMAERTEDPERKAQLAEEAGLVVQRGLEEYAAREIQDDARYSIHVVHFYGHLLHAKGRLARIGGDLPEAIIWFNRSRTVIPGDPLNTTFLARSHLEQAEAAPPGHQRLALAATGLRYFLVLPARGGADPSRQEEHRSIFNEQIAGPFPGLGAELKRAMSRFPYLRPR